MVAILDELRGVADHPHFFVVGGARFANCRQGFADLGMVLLAADAEFRREVIRLGAYLGWDESDVARFAERLTGRAWRDCEAAELGDVARSYAEIATRIRARLSNVEG